MIEVLLHLVSVDVVDVQVHDGKATAPALIAAGQLGVGSVEDPIKECEVVLDLLVSFDVKAILGLLDGSLEV